MRLAALGISFFVPAFAVFAASCSEDTPPSSSSGVFATSGGSTSSGSSSGGGASAAGVACTHPGAGNPITGQDGRCECTTTRSVAGSWSAKRTCREGDTCPLNVGEETFTVTQSGTSVKLEAGGKSLTGDLCGDIIVFNGITSGNRECGNVRLTDDTHWVSDSCYVAGTGSCNLSFGSGCPSQKGQCTGTATKGGAANAIIKDLCKTQ